MSEENQGSDQSAPAKSQKVKNYITISVDLLESNYKKLEEYADHYLNLIVSLIC